MLGSVIPGVGTAIGAAVGSGLSSGIRTGDPLAGIGSAAGSYFGSSIGGSLLGDTFGGTVGSTLGDAGLGSIASALPGALTEGSLGSVIGGSLGSSLGESALGSGPSVDAAGPKAPTPFSASREGELSLPGSLSSFSGLSPIQLGTNLATRGVYGGGEGPEESNYFLNMINRRLVDDSGAVDEGFGDIAPIESSYLDTLGFGGKKNPKDLLEALSGRFA